MKQKRRKSNIKKNNQFLIKITDRHTFQKLLGVMTKTSRKLKPMGVFKRSIELMI